MGTVSKLQDHAAPKHLTSEARQWWRSLVTDYDLDDPAGLLLLQTAMECFDRMRECQRVIAEDGVATRGSRKQIRSHPLLTTERDAKAQMLASLKALNLDIEPLRERPGRPGGS